MALVNKIKSFFPGKSKNLKYAKLLNGYSPIFSQFGQDIYASDVVQMCIDCIATECSKLQPRHIYTDSDNMQKTPKSSINRLFKFAPNELMTTSEFLEKIIWQLFMNYNCFILPTYENKMDNNNSRYYTGLYPLNPIEVDFLQDSTDRLFVTLKFSGGSEFTLPYSDLIHIRKKFSVNDIMGGGLNGQPDNTALLKVLQIDDTVMQGMAQAIKTSLSIKVIAKINTMLDSEKLQQERQRLEKAISQGDAAIITTDLKEDFVPIQIDPKLIDKDTMQFLQDRVLNWYGVSIPILTGKYTDEEYQAFYEKTLEPILIRLGQAFSKTLFTQRELDVGNEICLYQRLMMYLSTKSKLELLKTTGEQGLLSDDQKLSLLGYPPLEDGSGKRRTMSLNYIDVSLANEYQMLRAKLTKSDKQEEI